MDSRSYIPPIHTPTPPSPDAPINTMYAGSPSISYVQFSSFQIPPTDCLTAVILPGLTMAIPVAVPNLLV